VYDVTIVGAGPAGLNAALILGRCRRRALVCDSGHPRNVASGGLNGFLSRDGIKPAELRRIGREQLGIYTSVEIRDIEVSDVEQVDGRFNVVLADGTRVLSRKLLLATGVADDVPHIEGFDDLYGKSVFHCPTAMDGRCETNHWPFTAAVSTAKAWHLS
jgi:thioredoxin reductase